MGEAVDVFRKKEVKMISGLRNSQSTVQKVHTARFYRVASRWYSQYRIIGLSEHSNIELGLNFVPCSCSFFTSMIGKLWET